MPDLPPLKLPEGRRPRGTAQAPLPPLGEPSQPVSRGSEAARRAPQGDAGDLRRVTSRHRRGGSGQGSQRSESDAGHGEEAENTPLMRKGAEGGSDRSSVGGGGRGGSKDGAAPGDREGGGGGGGGGPRRVRKPSEGGSSVAAGSDRSAESGRQGEGDVAAAAAPAAGAPEASRGGSEQHQEPPPPQHTMTPGRYYTGSPGRYYTGEATRRIQANGRSTEEHGVATSTYTFQEDTGLLTTAAGAGDTLGERRHTMYVEQRNRRFVQVKGAGERGRFSLNPMAALRRRARGARRPEDSNPWSTADYEDDGNIAILKKSMDAFQSLASYISLFSQGLLGGLGLTNLVMTFLINPTDTTSSLRYYSPIAMILNRYYYVLVSFALVAAVNKYFRNTVLEWGQFGRRQRTFDALLIILYAAAYIVCVIITPYDDLLTYNSMRVPDYYNMELGTVFKSRFRTWQILTLIRMGVVLVAWFISATEFAPMTLMLYWRFSNPHRLVLPPLTRVHAPAVGPVPDAAAMPSPGPGSVMGSTMGAGAGGSPPQSYAGSPPGSLNRQGAAEALRQLQAQLQQAKVTGGATTTTLRPL